jgi:prostaglandin-E synthase
VPPVVWAQRSEKLYVTINIEDCKGVSVTFGENSLHFCGKSADKVDYDFTLEFYKEINAEKSKYAVLSRHIPMVIVKKDGGPYWPRLLKDTSKVHWLKTDFDKWRDEDDSDIDESKDAAFEDMMKNMGDGYNGPISDDELAHDSDDEDLPDLE